MKRFFTLSLIASLAFGMVSCTKEAPVENNSVAGKSFTIFASTPDTKTVVNDEMNGVEWVAGDAMSIFHVVAGSTEYVSDGSFTFTEGTEFNGTVNGELGDTNDWYAFYPYTSQITSPANTSGYVVVGSYYNGHQSQKGNDSMSHLAGRYIPLYGSAPGVNSAKTPSIAMKQAVTVLAINVTNTLDEELTVTSVSFTGTEDVVGKYFIDFSGAAPVFNKTATTDVSNKAELAVSGSTALAKGESAKYYIAVKPFVAKSGSKLILAVNGYEKEITLDADVEFTRAKIKTINFSYNKPVEVLPSVDTESEDYSEGFEAPFTAGSVYNNMTEQLNGPVGKQWASYYGTVSTYSKIAGDNSMQMRWYTSAKDALGYARTNFTLSKVKYVSFKASSTNALKVSLYYMNNGAWTLAETFNLSSTATTYEYEFVETLENVQLKFQVTLPDNLPTATSNVRIDDVLVSANAPEPVTLSSLSVINPKVTFDLNSSWSFGGTAIATYSDESTKNVTSSVTFSGNDTSSAGKKTVTVSYTEGDKTVSTQYDIEILQKTAEYVLATTTKGTNNAYAGNCDVTVNGITWNVTGNASMSPWRIGGKSIENEDRTVYSKNAISKVISSIELDLGNADGITINKITLISSSSDSFTDYSSIEISEGCTGNKTYTFAPEEGFSANCYYKFILNVTVSGTSNKFVEFKEARFYAQ